MQDRGVMVRKPSRSGVEIKVRTFIEHAGLNGAGVLFDRVHAATGVPAPAGTFVRLEDDDLVAGLVQLVRGGESGDACAEDEHALARARIRRKIGRSRERVRDTR